MESPKKSLGIFLHFNNSEYIPYYVLLYLRELTHHLDKVMLVTNERPINNEKELADKGIETLFVQNEGYDLGMFYKAFLSINPNDYHQIACINDSNILFNKLTTIFAWGNSTALDFWGLIDSHEKPHFSTHEENYHIQSHFVVFNEKAITLLPTFFNSIDIQDLFNESNIKTLREKVIDQWEIGLTQFFMEQGLTCRSFINCKTFSEMYLSGKNKNVGHKLYAELIHSGYPLVKKKVIKKHHWKDNFRLKRPWEKLVRKYGNPEWEIETLIQELIKMNEES